MHLLHFILKGDGPIPDKLSKDTHLENVVCPEKLKALIQSCRRQDPVERPTFTEVVRILKQIHLDPLDGIRKEEKKSRDEARALAKHQAFMAKLLFFKTTLVLKPSAEHAATLVWLQDSVDFVKSLGMTNVKWIIPEVYLNNWHLDKDLKLLEQDIVEFLKHEPDHVLKVVGGRGEGSGMMLYFGTRWALGVHPIKLVAVLGFDGLPPHRELLESIKEVEGSSDRAASLHVGVGYSRTNCSGLSIDFEEAEKYIDLLRFSGFDVHAHRHIYGDNDNHIKSYLMDAIKKISTKDTEAATDRS